MNDQSKAKRIAEHPHSIRDSPRAWQMWRPCWKTIPGPHCSSPQCSGSRSAGRSPGT